MIVYRPVSCFQKDAIIRELNDRLYIGTEKFHEYLTSPVKHSAHAPHSKHSSQHRHQNGGPLKHAAAAVDAGDDEGIHSGESYQHSTGNRSTHSDKYSSSSDVSVQDIRTVSSSRLQRAARLQNSVYYDMSSVRSNQTRSSLSSQRSARAHSERYGGAPWRPPLTDSLQYHSNATLPRQQPLPPSVQPHGNQSNTLPHVSSSQNRWRDDNTAMWPRSRDDGRYRYSGRSLPGGSHEHVTSQRLQQSQYQSQQFSQIDIGAMEHDALAHLPKTPSGAMMRQGLYKTELAPSHKDFKPDICVGMPSSQI